MPPNRFIGKEPSKDSSEFTAKPKNYPSPPKAIRTMLNKSIMNSSSGVSIDRQTQER